MWLREATAGQEILLGPFLDSTDGNTAETALTIANTDIKIWKEGATTEANKNSGGATHIASGRYYAVLDATDSNTLGKLEVNIHVSGALAVRREFMVLPAEVYDALVLGTDILDVSVTQFGGVAGTFSGGRPEVNASHWNDVDLGTTNPLPNVAAGAAGGLPTDSTGKTSFNDLTAAQVNAEADTALSDFFTSSAQLVDDFWNEAIAGHLTAGTAGLYLAIAGGVLVDTTATGTPTTTEIKFTGGNTNANFYKDQSVWVINGTGVGQVRPALSSSYAAGTTTLTFDEAFVTAAASGDRVVIQSSHIHPLSQVQSGLATEAKQDIIDTNVDTLVAQIGTAGAGLTDLGGMSTTMKAQIETEVTDGLNTAISAPVAGSLWDIINDLDARLPASGTISILDEAAVNGEMLDVMNVDTYAEPGQGAPPATTTLAVKINYLYKLARNKKEQTATTLSIYNDAGTTVDHKSTVSDDTTTATVGELVTGP